MRRQQKMICLLAALLLLAGCQRDDKDGPLAISGRIFVFNYRVATATYMVTLSRNADVPANSAIETRFENPSGGEPLVVRQKVFASQQKLALESPPLHCVVKDRPYKVEITLSDADGTIIQSLQTTVTSTEDQSIMPAKPLVVGPLYDRNPDVFRADGTADFSGEAACAK